MANNWTIPDWLEKEIRARDKKCIYCGVEFTPAKASKKQLSVWLQSKYCKERGINLENVAPIIKQAI